MLYVVLNTECSFNPDSSFVTSNRGSFQGAKSVRSTFAEMGIEWHQKYEYDYEEVCWALCDATGEEVILIEVDEEDGEEANSEIFDPTELAKTWTGFPAAFFSTDGGERQSPDADLNPAPPLVDLEETPSTPIAPVFSGEGRLSTFWVVFWLFLLIVLGVIGMLVLNYLRG